MLFSPRHAEVPTTRKGITMKRTFVLSACALSAYCWGLGDAIAWINPYSSVPSQEDATVVRSSPPDCSTDPDGIPDPYTVWVYADAPFRGRCKILLPGLYPSAGYFWLGNDTMSAIKIGAGARARLFEHDGYGGAWVTITSDQSSLANVSNGWNDVVSSMRVELANRKANCSDVGSREMALFRDANYQNDCVVLPVMTWTGYPITYSTPEKMGIANDSISSIKYRSTNITGFYFDANLSTTHGAFYCAYPPTQDIPVLAAKYGVIIGPNDQFSSIGPVANRYQCGQF
jgi:hypothetical protein